MTHVKGLAVLLLILVLAFVGTMVHVEQIREAHNALVERVARLEKMQKAHTAVLKLAGHEYDVQRLPH